MRTIDMVSTALLIAAAYFAFIAPCRADSASQPALPEDNGHNGRPINSAMEGVTAPQKAGVTQDQADATSLCAAVNGGDIKSVSHLLEHGARPNSTDKLGRSALFLAVDRQNLGAVKALLDAGADPNMGVIRPLMLAASYGSDPIVKMLIEYGAVVNAQSKDGETAIFFAVHNEHLETVRTLLRAGASVATEDNGNRILVDYTRDDEIELQEVLRSGKAYPTTQPLSTLDEALFKEIAAGNYDGVSKLVSRETGARPPCARALIAAVRAGDGKIVTLLLETGASANAVDEYGRSAIYLAAERNDAKMIRDLLTRGADPNADPNMGEINGDAARGKSTGTQLENKKW